MPMVSRAFERIQITAPLPDGSLHISFFAEAVRNERGHPAALGKQLPEGRLEQASSSETQAGRKGKYLGTLCRRR